MRTRLLVLTALAGAGAGLAAVRARLRRPATDPRAALAGSHAESEATHAGHAGNEDRAAREGRAAHEGLADRVREQADAVAAARRAGHATQRGRDGAVGFDLDRLATDGEELEPVVQYLTYIQSRRGGDSSLLFVRYDDIDAMAQLDGEPSEELLARLDQLGVVVSAN